MFNKLTTKVQFQDQQLDDYELENSILKSKLQSKIDALSIMSKELDKCSIERDRFMLLVEQFKCKKNIPMCNNETILQDVYRFTPTNTIRSGDMLAKTKDDNNMLKMEVEMLRTKLNEATGDIVALRRQLQKKEQQENNPNNMSSNINVVNKEYELLVQELENVQTKYQQLRLDYRATLDEKEELVSDRDYYKNKVQHLNRQISYILGNKVKFQPTDKETDLPKPIVDIDALVAENKYLNERLSQLQIEKELIKRTLSKYKTLLENRSKNESVHWKNKFADVMTQKQVREFLNKIEKKDSKSAPNGELRSLCHGLFDSLNDKSIALQHQRKTNQILANRIAELEKTLESWCNGQKCIPIFPSRMLLEERCHELVNSEEIFNGDLDEIQKKYTDSEEETKNSDSSMDSTCYEKVNGITTLGKTILPLELEELVREAMAELKPVN